MLTGGLVQSDPVERRLRLQYPHLPETGRTDQRGILLMLRKYRRILGQQALCGLIPMIGVGMGDQHRVGMQQAVDVDREIDPRVAQVGVQRALEPRVSATRRQKRVDQERFAGVVEQQGGVANLCQFHRWLLSG